MGSAWIGLDQGQLCLANGLDQVWSLLVLLCSWLGSVWIKASFAWQIARIRLGQGPISGGRVLVLGSPLSSELPNHAAFRFVTCNACCIAHASPHHLGVQPRLLLSRRKAVGQNTSRREPQSGRKILISTTVGIRKCTLLKGSFLVPFSLLTVLLSEGFLQTREAQMLLEGIV